MRVLRLIGTLVFIHRLPDQNLIVQQGAWLLLKAGDASLVLSAVQCQFEPRFVALDFAAFAACLFLEAPLKKHPLLYFAQLKMASRPSRPEQASKVLTSPWPARLSGEAANR